MVCSQSLYWGIILQLCSRAKRRRTQKLDSLLSDIKFLEAQNKSTSNISIANKLTKLHSDLGLLLLEQYDKHIQSLKLTHYSSGNQAGKFLAQQLKGCKAKTNIPFLFRNSDKSKIYNLKEIV